jgi:EthD domain
VAKFITLVRFAAGHRESARERFLEDALRRAILLPAPARYTVNIADVTPATAQEPPRYDVVEECAFDSASEFAAWGRAVVAGLPSDLAESIEACFSYHVSERVQLDDGRLPVPGERSPGVKAIYIVRRNSTLSDAEAKQRWKDHAPVAREHHVGMRRYVQNGVIDCLSAGAPIVNGIAELHFPSLADLEQRMYGSDAGRAAIAADVSTLVAESAALYTSEYVLRA